MGPSGPLLCTVAYRRELAQARVLAHSLEAVHRGSRLIALIIDGEGRGGDESFETLGAGDLGIADFEHLAAVLAPPALRSAARAWLLRLLRGRSPQPLLYLDPSQRLYRPPADILATLERSDLLLNPTLTAPVPDDGASPGPREVATWPAFDGGLVGVGTSPEAEAALDWWADRAGEVAAASPGAPATVEHLGWWREEEERFHTVELIPQPVYGNGRWLDLAAGMVPRAALLRDPGWNAGYWNLGGRRVEQSETGYEVDSSPLGSFNFRGFDPRRTSLLSRFGDRVSLAEVPALARLCDGYAAELEEQGAAEEADLEYGFDRLGDGTRFDSRLRRLYLEWAAEGPPRDSVFSEPGRRAFFDWLRAPAGPGAPSRYLFSAYLDRPDLQKAMPTWEAGFRERLAEWAATSGSDEMELVGSLLPGAEPAPVAGTVAKRRPGAGVPADSWGVNVVGFHRLDFGIAEAGRLLIEALDARQIPLLPIHDQALARYKAPGPPFGTLGIDSAAFPINLLCMNGDHLLDLAKRVGRGPFERRYSIGYWAWEVDRLPDEWLPALELLDEIWVPSAYVAETVCRATELPVRHIPEPVTAPQAPPPLDRSAYELPEDTFLFAYLFDFDSVGGRKNPLGLIEAFKAAFPPNSGASLLLKTSFADNAVGHFELLRQAAGEHPDIRLVDRRVSAAERDALLAGCDCYVSLHRSEGFGRTPAEAMALGRPVIATGYSGNLDYMDEDNSYLVKHRLVEVGQGHDPYPADARWAEPDVDDATRLMREVLEHPERARERGRRAAERIAETHSPDAVGQLMEARLVDLRRTLLSEAAAAPALRRSLPRRALARLRRLGRAPDAAAEAVAPEAQLALVSAASLAQTRRAEAGGEGREHAAARG